MDEHQGVTVKISSLPRSRADDFKSIYANNADVLASFLDLRVIFSEVVIHPGRELHASLTERASVVMSWEHAKALAVLLTQKVNEFELDHGPLRSAQTNPESTA